MDENKKSVGYELSRHPITGRPTMSLRGPWRSEFKDVFAKEGLTSLLLASHLGWRETDLSFLSELKFLQNVGVYSWDVTDLLPLGNLTELESIGIECDYKRSPDFSKFPKLRDCYLRWRPGSETIFRATTLQVLNIVNYPNSDLTVLNELSGLRTLKLTSAKLETLQGIAALTELSKVDLYNCPKLQTLSEIGKCSKLTVINIETCKRIGDVTAIGNLENIEELRLNQCGRIRSLMPLKNCKRLRQLIFSMDTTIEDGNLSIFESLPMLELMLFRNRKHYSHRCDEIGLR